MMTSPQTQRFKNRLTWLFNHDKEKLKTERVFSINDFIVMGTLLEKHLKDQRTFVPEEEYKDLKLRLEKALYEFITERFLTLIEDFSVEELEERRKKARYE